ncbi:MAG: Stk1 family PASTA domain-containing Ser/Thr kinase [Lactococcus raffinolactis]|jgi:serine/threonine protein kinase|uniref:non-specific serine/threonine protein kinase n=1 Tax=Pseudolactococcus raffinolactis TaxID=1366 RepID=A0A290QAY3_9LACT|nr:Stk1 family PASTA domain-containing Ser/Thr kinase [Lactococcus raffinolactis]ATC61072.1 serine/threonine protein kinase [Lactococcus raffinolactis]MBW9331502.1 Stk1 family PASTA domain-containing Ser/Thr kinase [Lactococcus raffinolactis]MDG4962521.1 Stk1 family PASTA domain-containing Ser/Thr kinase [Lactococcus raffinolactis]MDN5413559.1 Stk1 family PASTA domain-containing Ser/Thr kinase [Lactococcus raffinolactis]MDN5414410.1 Stk1 family PASTA domain-containing Ser/Thr kinase [Lactococc
MIQIGKIYADRYHVIREIGRGGMANVYLAEDTYLDNRQVAIKILRSNFENDSLAIARFQREAYAMAELNHPNIVGISDVGDADDQQYIVMEYIDGLTLKQYINEHAPLANEEAIRIGDEILAAMALAHSSGIIHRDLKPQNILITKDGTAKVTDFGIAKALSETSLTQTNSMFGSVHYLSPEQARGGNATPQSDLYAIGIIIYEMLTGAIPFDGDSAVTIALKHFQENLPSIINQNKNVPQALENVVIKATAKKLSDRYANVTDMRRDLNLALSLDHAHDPKLTFTEDADATKILPKMLIPDNGNTDKLVTKVTQDTASHGAAGGIEPLVGTSKKKRVPKGLIIGGVVALILVIAVAALIWTTPKEVKVPDVTNMTVAQAKTVLENNKLKVGREIKEISDLPEGKVTRTNPEAKTVKKEGASVNLYVSKGGNVIKLTNYVGWDVDKAIDDLILKHNVDESRIKKESVKSDSIDAGKIIKQTPKKGALFDLDGTDDIVFQVSEGNQAVMPTYMTNGLSTKTVAAVKAELQNMGVPDANITVEYTKTTDQNSDGYVIGSTPAQGESFKLKDTKIVLTVLQFDSASASKEASESESKSKSESEASASKSAEDSRSKSEADANASKSSSSIPANSTTQSKSQ